MCEQCAGTSSERVQLCRRIRSASAAVLPSEYTLDELRELAALLESVAAAVRNRDGLPARLGELINLGRRS